MKIVHDNRADEILRIEHLLYGANYAVWLNLYGPLDTDLSIEQVIQKHISKSAKIANIQTLTPNNARSEILESLCYLGDSSSGPINLAEKQQEVIELSNVLFSRAGLHEASIVCSFSFTEGHPAYPVYWDFSFDIHSQGKRWIFLGSSSD
ncbi:MULTISPECIES: hypothetical protein [unclassified Pseudomonas]|uniref:hypothetical protein n=1 Tax=unclassified Pseudomonas TaxID=196821 RepID=UPI00257C5CD0|nr:MULTISPECIES: hypothetical protein [unclassified Pseudomonas]